MPLPRMSAQMDLALPEDSEFIRQWRDIPSRKRQQWLRSQAHLGVATGARVLSRRASPGSYSTTEGVLETVRVQIDLNMEDPQDRIVFQAYTAEPKSRRGIWLKNMLLLGYKVWQGEGGDVPLMGEFLLQKGSTTAPASAVATTDSADTQPIAALAPVPVLVPAVGAANSVIEPPVHQPVSASQPADTTPAMSTTSADTDDQGDDRANADALPHASALRGMFGMS